MKGTRRYIAMRFFFSISIKQEQIAERLFFFFFFSVCVLPFVVLHALTANRTATRFQMFGAAYHFTACIVSTDWMP